MDLNLPVTSYALLGLLTFGDELTGYELKQRADATLRFYWVSPAMSQVYTELARLAAHGLVAPSGEGRGTTYGLTDAGRAALTTWMRENDPGFPVLKHPIALRLLLGHLLEPAQTRALLEGHLEALARERAALDAVRTSLQGRDGPADAFYYPSLVADWGLEYFDGEDAIIRKLLDRLD